MKKIDLFIIKSFIAPFIATFCIGLFVLIMQFLWIYIDDIIGKGTGFLVMVELLSYLSVSLVPMALPIAVLISSVMVLGNMAEHYELAALKSAGIPLLRVMRPLIFVCIGVSFLSFFCSNYLIPIANLKFKSRLYDIKKQKPMLSLEVGTFNDDFKNMIIHIGKKDADNKTIRDIIIYDHNSYNDKKASMTTAEKGEMFTTKDEQFFVMKLYNGTQYNEAQSRSRKEGNAVVKSYPFVRTSYSELTKIFDLTEFSLKETDTDLFKNNHTMLSSKELSKAIDSLKIDIQKRYRKGSNNLLRNYNPLKKYVIIDSLPQKAIIGENQPPQKPKSKVKPPKKVVYSGRILEQVNSTDAIKKDTSKYFVDYFIPKERSQLLKRVKSSVQSIINESNSNIYTMDSRKESLVKHIFELNDKYSMAISCFIFLFIGAPMGAIIRKGGFGYPLLVSIFFFVLFIVMRIFFKKVAESLTLSAVFAAWLPCIILFPIGLFLTIKAMNDSTVINTDKITIFWKNTIARFNKNKKAA